jgi:iron complex transport system substrate-binding protein
LKNNILLRSAYHLSLLIILILTAITADANGENSIGGKEGYITITDCTGRNVLVPEKVDRIACLYLVAGHVVTMLGRGDDIVAVSNGLKRASLLLDICPSIKNAMVPKSQGAINMEELLKAAPDVLFIASDMSGNRGELEKLDRFGIPTIIIDYSDMQSQQKAISIIGEAIGRKERAEEYNRFYKKTVDRVKAITDKLPEDKRLRVYYSENEATRTTLDNDLSTDWLEITGVKNVAVKQSGNILEGKNFISVERILLWNPEIILANEPEAIKLMQEDRKWAAIDAVKNKRIYQMPIAISRWGHPGSIETPLAILWTAKKMYPSLFNDINMEKETKNYYKTFFNYDLPDSKVNAILEGDLIRKPKHGEKKGSRGQGFEG